MDDTILGKITEIKLGIQDGRFGLWITLSGDWSVMSDETTWDPTTVKITKYTNWTEKDRDNELIHIMHKISKLLNDAKVNNLNQLLNIPVEIKSHNNTLSSWRILKEVL